MALFRALLLLVAFVQSAVAFRAPMTAVPQLSSVARAAPQMALPSMADAKSLSDEEIAKEILTAQKELFELRKKVKTRQEVKPHLFTHTKHRIAQLNTLLAQRSQ
mmetsp:Transcript_10910/g.24863  ORF Transcript_10910/g.24863 Transcript_10910/m.24863 type:complete len:105 (-) Transcript_10910:386-700(-)